MKRLRAALARFFRLSDPKGCAYGEPRCPGGLLCKHDRAEIRHVIEHEPSHAPVDEQLHRYGYAVTERPMSARELQAKRAREGKPYINERGQLVDGNARINPNRPDTGHAFIYPRLVDLPLRLSYDQELQYIATHTTGSEPAFDVRTGNRPTLPRYSVPWPESVGGYGLPIDIRQARDAFVPEALIGEMIGGARLTAEGKGGGSYALHNVVDREHQVDELTAGSTDPETRGHAEDALDDAFIDSLDRSE